MADSFQPKEPLPSTDLDSEDLQTIFDNIDDHLAFWEVLFNDSVSSQEEGQPISQISLAQFITASDWLKMSSAPLYMSQDVGGVRGLVYRFLNLAVKIFGSPQIRFNRKLREFLGELQLTIQEFNQQTVTLKSTVENLKDRILMLELENADHRQEIETLSWHVRELQIDLDRITDERGGENRV